jgi:hypothetical protein
MITAYMTRNWQCTMQADDSIVEFLFDHIKKEMIVARKNSDGTEIVSATETWDCETNSVWDVKFADGTMILFLWYAGESCKVMHRLPGDMFFHHSYYCPEITPFPSLLKNCEV